MKKLIVFTTISILGFSYSSCDKGLSISEPVTISLDNPVKNKPLSEIFEITGFTSLQINDMHGMDRVRRIDKVLIKDGIVYALDHGTDFKNIWRFRESDGERLGKFDFQTNNPDGLSDIAISKDGTISCLAAAKRAFMNYSSNGEFRQAINNGMIGDQLLRLPNNDYLVYNEYSATEISGYNQLLFYNSKGDLIKRLYPYNRNLDNIAYSLSGFISESDHNYWFSPPFCDTVYEINSYGISSRYLIDFGKSSVPINLRNSKLASGWDVDKYHYLTERFIKLNGDYVLFEHYADGRLHLGIFDERLNTYVSFNDAPDDQIKTLIRYGSIFPKNEDTFTMLLTSERIKYLLKNESQGIKKLGDRYTGILQFLLSQSDQESPNPLLLYISVKK